MLTHRWGFPTKGACASPVCFPALLSPLHRAHHVQRCCCWGMGGGMGLIPPLGVFMASPPQSPHGWFQDAPTDAMQPQLSTILSLPPSIPLLHRDMKTAPGTAAPPPTTPPSTAGGLSPGPNAAPDGAGVRRCERDGFITRSLLLRLLSIRSCHLPLPLMGREEASVTGAERALLRAAACCSRPRPRSRPFLPFSFPPSSLTPSLPFLPSLSLSTSGFHVLLLQLPLSSHLHPSTPLSLAPLYPAVPCPHPTSPFSLPALSMLMAISLSLLPRALDSPNSWAPIPHPIH